MWYFKEFLSLSMMYRKYWNSLWKDIISYFLQQSNSVLVSSNQTASNFLIDTKRCLSTQINILPSTNIKIQNKIVYNICRTIVWIAVRSVTWNILKHAVKIYLHLKLKQIQLILKSLFMLLTHFNSSFIFWFVQKIW